MAIVPTAFIKKQTLPSTDGEEKIITWNKSLYWGQQGSVQTTTTWPFENGDGDLFSPVSGEDFYDTTDRVAGDTLSYYGWYLHGGALGNGDTIDLSSYHQADPWHVGTDGLQLRLDFEADWDTAAERELDTDSDVLRQYYNQFIQSGYALGTFNLNSTSTLTVKASGLGEMYQANTTDLMDLSVDNTVLCSGSAPGNNGTYFGLDESEDGRIDVRQVKLYSQGGGSPVNTQPRANQGQWVNQDDRISYTTVSGIGTFTKSNLAAGSHTIKINFSTIDSKYNSGVFYGFTFSFS